MKKLRIIYVLFALLAVSCGRDELIENEVQRPVVPGKQSSVIIEGEDGDGQGATTRAGSSLAVMQPVQVCMMARTMLRLLLCLIRAISLLVLPVARQVAALANLVAKISIALISNCEIGNLRFPLRRSSL